MKDISYSKLVLFSTNPILFKIKYLNGDIIESTKGISGVIGQAFHVAMNVYYGGSDEHVIVNESDAVKYGLEVGAKFLEEYNDGFIKFSTTIPNKQKAIEKFVFLFQSYIKEYPHNPKKENIIETEEKIEEYIDVEWKGKKVVIPVKLKGYLDKIYEEKGQLCIEDYKTVSSYSDPEKIDGAKILQAVEYYFLVYAKYGMAPKKIVFSEVKMTANQDKSPQVRKYPVVYEENELFFDFYFRYYADVIRAINGEQVFVPNINAMYDNEVAIISYIHHLDEPEKLAEAMKKLKVENITDLLKKEIQNASSMKSFMTAMEKTFQSYQTLDYEKMKLPEKIKMKLMEFGILVNFDSEIVGHSVTLYRFHPAIGVRMKTIESHIKDIEQVVGVAGIRILAPIPNTSLVGFEVPNAKRTFVEGVPSPKGFEIAIGVDIEGNTKYFDIREAPHMLVAGATGAGKSVFLSSVISQLSKIKNLQMYLCDPKIVELAMHKKDKNVVSYNNDPIQIQKTLANIVEIVEERYKILAEAGCRNIKEYSGKMPYIVTIIDEFGDLMTSSDGYFLEWRYCDRHKERAEEYNYLFTTKKKLRKREIEMKESVEFCDECERFVFPPIDKIVQKISAKARACGVHLIIATQRPSVDVISGVIKANFPTKVAFRMAKETDSRVLIDEAGAEKLLGKGDMLFSTHEGVSRLQGFNC